MGRALETGIVLHDDRVSRLHAKVQLTAAEPPIIYDLESKNGTRVNGLSIGGNGYSLEDGDQVQLSANTVLKFSWQKPAEEALQGSLYQCAVKDWLTQAHNKRYLTERLEQEFSYAERHGRALSLLLIDLDNFKTLNDRWGHVAGDSALKHVATFMAGQLRNEDVIARYGGEEFVILLRQIELPEAFHVAERLRVGIQKLPIKYKNENISCTVSIGLACTQVGEFQTANDFFVSADQSLYRAKNEGRNRTAHEGGSEIENLSHSFARRPTKPPEEA